MASELPFDEQIADAIEFRQEFGLRADEDYVRSLADQPAGEYGLPLTADEEHELDSRDSRFEEGIGAVVDYGTSSAADSYAGVYIDQAAGEFVTVGFTRDLDVHRAAVAAIYPDPSRLRFFTARYTEAELRSVQERIEADFDSLIASGMDVQSVGVDVQRNRVEVGARNPSSSKEQSLRATYHPSVVLFRESISAAGPDPASTALSAGPF